MKEHIKFIENDILTATTKFAKKNILYVTGAYLVVSLLIIGLFLALYLAFSGFFETLFTNISTQDFSLSSVNDLEQYGIVITIGVLVSLFLNAWFINYSLIQINSYVLKNNNSLSRNFNESISNKILKTVAILLFMFILSIFIYSTLIFFSISLSNNKLVQVLLVLVSTILIMTINLKISISIPISLFSDKNVSYSILESIQKVKFLIALKYIGILFIVLIGVGAVFFIATFIVNLILGFLGVIGTVLGMIFQLFVYGFLFSLIFSFIISLYHDVISPQIETEIDLNDNLIL